MERTLAEVISVAQDILGARILRTRPAEGGFTPAMRLVVECDDGATAFVKAATVAPTVQWLRDEHRFYAAVRSNAVPRFVGFERDVLVLEDLSHAHWPPPWLLGELDALLETLEQVARLSVPFDVQSRLEKWAVRRSWEFLAQDPGPFLALGLCTKAWYERALPLLVEAEDAAPVEGDDLLHADVRSDNVCLHDGHVVLVDWNNICRGSAAVDVAFLLPSLAYEGGPEPDDVLPDAPGLASVVAGFFARQAGLDDVPNAPLVRWVQRKQLRTALPWAARALDLPTPDGPNASDDLGR